MTTDTLNFPVFQNADELKKSESSANEAVENISRIFNLPEGCERRHAGL
jgi:hypothetical protein